MSAPTASTPPTRWEPAGSPGRPGTPSLGTALRAEYRLLLRSGATRGRLAAIGALALLSILSAFLRAGADPVDPFESAVGYVNGNVATLFPIAVLVFGAAMLGDLIDDGSLVYLWLRPIPTWVHVVAAWAATVTITVPLVFLPVLASTLVIDTSPEIVRATLVAGPIAIASYAGLFVMVGVRFRRALPWGLLYILIWEGFVASAGETASRLAIRSYVRSILASITETSLKLGDFSLAVGIVVPLLVALAALAYAARRLNRTDVA